MENKMSNAPQFRQPLSKPKLGEAVNSKEYSPKGYEEIISSLRNLINDEPHRAVKWEQDFIFATGHYRVEYHAKQGSFVIEQRLFDRVEFDADNEEYGK